MSKTAFEIRPTRPNLEQWFRTGGREKEKKFIIALERLRKQKQREAKRMKGEINLPKGRKSQVSRQDNRIHEGNGPVTTYQLSEEELAKYRAMPKQPYKKSVTAPQRRVNP